MCRPGSSGAAAISSVQRRSSMHSASSKKPGTTRKPARSNSASCSGVGSLLIGANGGSNGEQIGQHRGFGPLRILGEVDLDPRQAGDVLETEPAPLMYQDHVADPLLVFQIATPNLDIALHPIREFGGNRRRE